jgi:hypothetical protein
MEQVPSRATARARRSKLGHQQSLAELSNHFDQRILFVLLLGLLESLSDLPNRLGSQIQTLQETQLAAFR